VKDKVLKRFHGVTAGLDQLDAFDNLTDIEKRAFDKGFNGLFFLLYN